MELLDNVISIKKGVNVQELINNFLNSVGVSSTSTRLTYESAIRDFFLNTRGKQIEFVSLDDLHFTYMEVEVYRNSLIGKYKNSTINTKMIAVKKLYDKLEKYDLKVDSSVFDLGKLSEHDTNSYDMLNLDEVKEAMSIVSKTKNGFEKSLLIEIAFVTALRKSVLLGLTWDSIYEENGMFIIKTLGKGNKWSLKRIDEDLYMKLMGHKDKVQRKSVFAMSSTTVQRMMELIKREMEFGNRNITFHSFKKASIEEVGIQTNYDIKAMQMQGDHSDVSTTLNIYVAKKDLENMPVLSTSEKEIDLSPIKSLTKDEILGIIDSMDRETQIKMLNVAKNRK